MADTPWVPWHKALALRDNLRTGELSLAVFAADLYDVVMGKARGSTRTRPSSSPSPTPRTTCGSRPRMSACGLRARRTTPFVS